MWARIGIGVLTQRGKYTKIGIRIERRAAESAESGLSMG